jgi:hypothetical protein
MNLGIMRDSRLRWISLVTALILCACGRLQGNATTSPTASPAGTAIPSVGPSAATPPGTALPVAPETCPTATPTPPAPSIQSPTPTGGATSPAIWSRRSSPLTPPQVGSFAMAYDGHRNQLVMYGNPVGGGPDTLGVTWVWNGTDWAQADRSGQFFATALVYDAKLGSIVAFSFLQSTPQSRQWNGSAWSPPVSGGPSPRGGEALAYDPVSGKVVVFGGRRVSEPYLGDTWTWDGSQWTQQHPATSPTPRLNGTMAYDPNSRKLLLFGGEISPMGQPSTDTWSWDGSSWTQLTPTVMLNRQDLLFPGPTARLTGSAPS